ncbi:MAG: hypothetical protein SAJ37_17340 [Oscillatoria sp. PMC 1068.18]|nr:hypothetical protein [Oscillatoria sp. PMC 1068.18]
MENSQVLEEFETQVKKWHRSAVVLHTTYIVLGVISVVSSITVASFVEELGIFNTRVLAAISAGSVTLIETTGVGRKGNGFRQAQRHLRAGTIRARTGEISTEELIKIFSESELMIGDVLIKTKNSLEPETEV